MEMLESLPGVMAAVLGVVFLAALAAIIGMVVFTLVAGLFVPARSINYHRHHPMGV